jgi:hypothetical protein
MICQEIKQNKGGESGMSVKKTPVWINGVRYNDAASAAARRKVSLEDWMRDEESHDGR